MQRTFLVLLGTLLLISSAIVKSHKLPEQLKEISGISFINDTTLVAHNDSGNDPILYLLNLDGSIRSQVAIDGVKNIDFEDITTDGKYLYVGDIGNNNNMRKDLVIHKIALKDIAQKTTVQSAKIHFNYPEQTTFPPAPVDRNFDAEALAYADDSLYIFTKCRTEPFDGKCYYYRLPTKPGRHVAKRQGYITVGKRSVFQDGITAATVFKDELYLLTYNRILIYRFSTKKPSYLQHISMLPLSQKESIDVHRSGQIFVADEVKRMFGGGKLMVVKRPVEKEAKK